MGSNKLVDGKKAPKTQADIDRREAQQPTPEQELQEKREGMILTPCQFLDGLESIGKMTEAKAIVANAPYQVKNKFNRATQYERTHQMINQFGAYLWPVDTDTELDNFFIMAMEL